MYLFTYMPNAFTTCGERWLIKNVMPIPWHNKQLEYRCACILYYYYYKQ